MKNSRLKIALICTFITLLLLGGAIFYCSTLVTPERVRTTTLELLQKNFPKAKIELGVINYSFGTSITFKLNNFKMINAEQEKLLEINQLNLKIPIWAILFGGGTVYLQAEAPKFSYLVDSKGSNNWIKAKGSEKIVAVNNKKVTEQAKTAKDKKSETKVVKKEGELPEKVVKDDFLSDLPGFVKKSKVKLKLTNVLLNYQLKDDSKGVLTFSRVIINNLGLSAHTAFEVASDILIENKKGAPISLDTLIIGQANLTEYLVSKKISSKLDVTLKNIQIPQIKRKIPSFKADISFDIDGSKKINGTIHSQLAGLGSLTTHFAKDEHQLHLSQIAVELITKEVISLFEMQVSGISDKGSKVKINGDLNLKKGKIHDSNLVLHLSEGMSYKLSPHVALAPEMTAKFTKGQLNIESIIKVLEGTIEINGSTKLNQEDFSLEALKFNLQAANITIPKEDLNQLLYKEKKNNKVEAVKKTTETSKEPAVGSENGTTNIQAKKTTIPKETKEKTHFFPSTDIRFSLKNIKVDQEVLKASGNIVARKNTIGSKDIKFDYSKGSGKIVFLTTFVDEYITKTNLDAGIVKLNLNSFRPFLPSNLEGIEGTFTGSAKGNVIQDKLSKKTTYDFHVDVEAVDGELRKLNLAEYIKETVDKVPLLSKKISEKGINVSNSFKLLAIEGQFKPTQFKFDKYMFVDNKEKLEMNGRGIIFPMPKSELGEMVLDVTDLKNSWSTGLEKETGSKTIPIKLTGHQFNLRPDLDYTLKKLSKLAFKKQGRKQLDQLKNKYLNDENKDKVKKLFKGLFK